MKLTAKVLSVMLTLFVVLSLVPGISLVAYAADEGVSFDQTSISMYLGETKTLAINNTTGKELGTVTWSPSGDTDEFITLGGTSASGCTITPKKAGTTTVTATYPANAENGLEGGTLTCNVTVSNPTVTISGDSSATKGGDPVTLTATVTPASLASHVRWSSTPAASEPNLRVTPNASDPTKCDVQVGPDFDGDSVTVTADLGADYPTVTPASKEIAVSDVQTSDDTYKIIYSLGPNTMSGAASLDKTAGNTTLKIKGKDNASDESGYYAELVATVVDQDGNAVSPQPSEFNWTIDDSSKVKLNNASQKAKQINLTSKTVEGETTLRVSTTVGGETVTDSVKVNVFKPSSSTPSGDDDDEGEDATSIDAYLWDDDRTVYVGNSYDISDLVGVDVEPDGADPDIVWSVDPSQAKIEGNKITPLVPGKITLTAKTADGKLKDSVKLDAAGFIAKEGKGGVYTKGSNKNLPFKIVNSNSKEDKSTTFDYFEDAGAVVYVEGDSISRRYLKHKQDFTYSSGSVNLTLLPAFLETLDPGTYYLTAEFEVPSEGTVDSEKIKFIVKKKGDGSGSNPATADYLFIGLGVFMFLLALTYVCLFTYDKKQRKLRLRRRIAHRRYY